MSSFNSTHLKTLLATSYAPQGAVGRIPLAWAERVVARDSINHLCLPNLQLTRSKLRKFCKDPKNCIEACFISTMAWGGMWFGHGRRVWEKRQKWTQTLGRLRADKLSRKDAFCLMKELRDNGDLSGMRAAYFTKPIFFLRPLNNGYIMDQWTAKSVNVLFGRKIVRINNYGYVSDENDPTDYERFCSCIDEIASVYGKKNDSWKRDGIQSFGGERAEELIFSKSGSPWREYVKAHWARI